MLPDNYDLITEMDIELASVIATFYANLKRLMRIRGITYQDLATGVGVSKSVVAKWVSGDNFPSHQNLDKICHFFSIRPIELFADENELMPNQISKETIAITELITKRISDLEKSDQKLREELEKLKNSKKD